MITLGGGDHQGVVTAKKRRRSATESGNRLTTKRILNDIGTPHAGLGSEILDIRQRKRESREGGRRRKATRNSWRDTIKGGGILSLPGFVSTNTALSDQRKCTTQTTTNH
ncbi:MAG: hypothetical protein ACYTEQ_29135 [Planctomycetota bacterium]